MTSPFLISDASVLQRSLSTGPDPLFLFRGTQWDECLEAYLGILVLPALFNLHSCMVISTPALIREDL